LGFIRVGFFEDFKGADTLLIGVDHEGLRDLLTWLREVTSSGRKAWLNECPGVSLRSGLRVELVRAPNDGGLLKMAATEFVWRRSEEGWLEIIAKLEVMEAGACHQYLDGPRDDVQPMASIGEYGDEWWNSPHTG
jgi:hypothetical protein